MDASLIGLSGVLLGGVITAGANWILAARRERIDANNENKAHIYKIRRASRMIGQELQTAAADLQICLNEQRRIPEFKPMFKTVSWETYKSEIAPELSASNWRILSTAFLCVEMLSRQQDRDFTIEEAEQMTSCFKTFEDGECALATLDSPPTAEEMKQDRWQR